MLNFRFPTSLTHIHLFLFISSQIYLRVKISQISKAILKMNLQIFVVILQWPSPFLYFVTLVKGMSCYKLNTWLYGRKVWNVFVALKCPVLQASLLARACWCTAPAFSFPGKRRSWLYDLRSCNYTFPHLCEI